MPIGTKFDDFLKEEGIYEDCTAAAEMKVIVLESDESTAKNTPAARNSQLQNHSARQEEKSPLLYLDDVQKNLHFLYRYSGVVGSMRAFGASDQVTAEWISAHSQQDFGHAVTIDGVCELGIFERALLMLEFMDSGRPHLLDRVLDSPCFGKDVMCVFYTLSKIPLEKRLEAQEKEAAEAKKISDEVMEGEKKRADSAEEEAQKFRSELSVKAEKGKARIIAATHSRRNNSKIPDINDWFAKQEKEGRNLLDRSLTKEAGSEFGVDPGYIATLRRLYFASKNATTVR